MNFFSVDSVDVLDGTWHSVCLAWRTPDVNMITSYVYLVIDGEEITGIHTLAGTDIFCMVKWCFVCKFVMRFCKLILWNIMQ